MTCLFTNGCTYFGFKKQNQIKLKLDAWIRF